jgi:hypothetical protein
MSRSELAQSIDGSTQGKVTHRRGDFNRKLGGGRVLEWSIKTVITIGYGRDEGTHYCVRLFLGTAGRSFRPQPDRLG